METWRKYFFFFPQSKEQEKEVKMGTETQKMAVSSSQLISAGFNGKNLQEGYEFLYLSQQYPEILKG